MQHQNENGYFLQQFYSSFAQNIQMQPYHTPVLANADYINIQNIDHLVDMEMQLIKENCARKEQQYVEQMLLENPITIERRTNTYHQQQSSTDSSNYQQQQQSSTDDEEVVDVISLSPGLQSNSHALIQQQRAEACRRSRYNNKIKKAKSKYRHKFMSQKLLQSFQMFNCIHDVIDKVETHLVARGLSNDKLLHLRHSYGIENAILKVRDLEQTIKIEN